MAADQVKTAAVPPAAIVTRLRDIQFSQACRTTAGSWKDEDHPELRTIDDLRLYMRELRDPDQWRMPAAVGPNEPWRLAIP